MPNQSPILNQYSALLSDLDQRTAEVYARAPEIPCKNKCFDCCKQLFPVSFVEAWYMSQGLKTLDRTVRRERSRAALRIAEKIRSKNPAQFEKKAVSRTEALNTHAQFARFLHTIESDCPALDPKNKAGACTVYPFRNHDCREMGFSFDPTAGEIIGCFRFNSLKHLAPKLARFGHRYSEKTALDQALIKEVTGGTFTQNILYYTTMCGPLLKDFAAEDWLAFFTKQGIPARSKSDEYWVVIDV